MATYRNTSNKQNIVDVTIGDNVKIYDFVNLYGCEIGENTQIGTFVEIQRGVKIGKNCRIQSHTFISEGVTIEDNVFIGHNVVFINDKNPTIEKTINKTWTLERVLVKRGAVIGSGAVIMAGVIVGNNAVVGAGAVVLKNVDAKSTVVGNPAKKIE